MRKFTQVPLATDGSLSNYRETKARLILSGVVLGWGCLILVCPTGCRTERVEDFAQRLGPIHDAIRSRTTSNFELAVLWKPSDDSPANDLLALAPLIVQEIASGPRDSDDKLHEFKALENLGQGPDSGSSSVEGVRPTIYAGVSIASLSGVDYELAQYAWTYPGDPGWESVQTRKWTFLLGLVDGDGFGLLWSCAGNPGRESSTDLDPYQLYVSKSLELGAKHVYRVPSRGRKYTIEPALERWPQLVVAGLIEDGPVPMGPYVYLDARELEPITLMCRCSPSQVNAFTQSGYYELRPMDDLRAAMSEKAWSAFEKNARFRRNEFLKTVVSLRWPRDAEAEADSRPTAPLGTLMDFLAAG